MSEENTTFEIQDSYTITDVETLKTIAHPQRIDIVRLLDEPKTVKQVADALDADPTKLYYHVRLLEKAGIIRVVATNVVSGIIEKQYQAIAHSFQMAEELTSAENFTPDDLEQVVSSVLDTTRTTMRRALRDGLINLEEKSPHRAIMAGYGLSLTTEQVLEFEQQMQALLDQVSQWSTENQGEGSAEFWLSVAFFPTAKQKELRD